MLTNAHSSSAARLTVLTPLVPPQDSSSPSPRSSSSSGESSEQATTPVRPPSTPPRTRSRTGSLSTANHTRLRSGRARSYTANMPFFTATAPSAGPSSMPSTSRTTASFQHLDLGSPPPYSPEPPEIDPNSPFLAKRAASSPHLQSPPLSPDSPHVYSQSHPTLRRPSSSALRTSGHSSVRARSMHARVETDEDDTDTASGDDAVVYRSRERERPPSREREPSLAEILRERLFGKGKGRSDVPERVRFITTVPGVLGAGETETESEDAVSKASIAAETPYIAWPLPLVS
ncbi:uncharacterized protein PHACADRAFT_199963 [Phanerochaete carnosa HHB-10118-sp]|uniref:Uncharacterized protein n=1 Tax=Phanerochaete carnosa (strain HHB-10118-sp) TaxID=650164 RepID=K5VWC9_PHACS|nr:uncharacterized protein PHACADRAFT_199963 [Phanerochaete carnosa HHB-10118-sp]EKM51130.1 hypothetical protein PHACADRAFT_199963 [Phanerochaete carnosa HHB-10118-sp]